MTNPTPQIPAPSPSSFPRWALWVATILFPALLICIIFDRETDKLLTALAWLLLGVMALADRPRTWDRLSATLTIALSVILIAAVIAFLTCDFPTVLRSMLKYQVPTLWIAITWLALPIFTPASSPTQPHSVPSALSILRSPISACVACLLAFTAWATFSAAASLFPKDSLDLLGSELLPYAGIFILILRLTMLPSSTSSSSVLRSPLSVLPYPLSSLPRTLWLITILASLAMAIIAILAQVSPELARKFLDVGFFRIDADAPETPRLQFLFHHHNRAGFFAACAIFISLAGAFGRSWWRATGIIGAIAAAIALPFTLTRGALVAAAAGMAFFTILGLTGYRRGRWALLAAFLVSIPLIWALLPDNYQDHIAKITNFRNYREGQGGSIGARLIMWNNAADMIDKRPVLGFGYGFENFEAAARHDNPTIPNYFKHAVHAHNQWLETGAEIGLPGLILLALFTASRMLWLLVAWWQSRRARHPLAWLLLLWLSLEITIQFYGLTNYSLRRNLGYLTYALWATSIALILTIHPSRHAKNQP